MMTCPKCGSSEKQYKIGKTGAGSQRYRCSPCGYRYTPIQKSRGYDSEYHQKAIRLYMDGYGPRQIGRFLGIHHSTINNWVHKYLNNLPDNSGLLHYQPGG